MKTYKILAVSLLSVAFTAPSFAEPMAMSMLSVHGQQASDPGSRNVTINRTAGMNKYLRRDARQQEMAADTEIAVFEEVNDRAGHRPVRMDRIPGP